LLQNTLVSLKRAERGLSCEFLVFRFDESSFCKLYKKMVSFCETKEKKFQLLPLHGHKNNSFESQQLTNYLSSKSDNLKGLTEYEFFRGMSCQIFEQNTFRKSGKRVVVLQCVFFGDFLESQAQ
jgi:predicted AlkP superfamily pyrophosphatase or phosphodiesterase